MVALFFFFFRGFPAAFVGRLPNVSGGFPGVLGGLAGILQQKQRAFNIFDRRIPLLCLPGVIKLIHNCLANDKHQYLTYIRLHLFNLNHVYRNQLNKNWRFCYHWLIFICNTKQSCDLRCINKVAYISRTFSVLINTGN